jgi:hypothetical protein
VTAKAWHPVLARIIASKILHLTSLNILKPTLKYFVNAHNSKILAAPSITHAVLADLKGY